MLEEIIKGTNFQRVLGSGNQINTKKVVPANFNTGKIPHVRQSSISSSKEFKPVLSQHRGSVSGLHAQRHETEQTLALDNSQEIVASINGTNAVNIKTGNTSLV